MLITDRAQLAVDRLRDVRFQRAGHLFSRDLEPILTVDSGDSIAFSCLNAGWRTADHELYPDRAEGEADAGHALIGPVEVRGAPVGQALEVRHARRISVHVDGVAVDLAR